MRLFIAIELAPNVREGLERLLPKLAPLAPDAKWVKAGGTHLTLAFLGHVDAAHAEAFAQAMRETAARHAPLTLSVRGGGSFGRPTSPSVVWLGVNGETERLAALHAALDQALAVHGYEPETRAFTPHLTLARGRGPRGDRALARCVAELEKVDLGELAANELVLFESTLSPKGPSYAKVATAALSGAR